MKLVQSFWLLSIFSLFSLLLVGCGGSCGESEVGATAACQADPLRVAAQDRCLTDETCPCGTFCDLGRCLAQCTGNSDCSGSEQCNSFGQCQDRNESDRLRLPRSATAGELRFPFSERNLPPEEVFQVDLIAGDQDVIRARVIASFGVQIRCSESEEWSTECELSDVPARSMLQIDAQAKPSGDDSGDSVASIEVITASRSDSLSLQRPEQRAEVGEQALPAPVSGTYEGRIRLVGVGTDRDLSALAKPATMVFQEIRATVWERGDEYVIQIEDGLNALSSRDTFIGSFTLGDPDADSGVRSGTASFPVHPYLETTVGGRDTILLASTVEGRVRTRNQPRRVSLELTHSYLGAGADVAPSARWIVELNRNAGARGEPAAIPRDVEFSDYDPEERLLVLPPWQKAFGQTVSADLDPGAVLAWYEGDIAPLVMCDAEKNKTSVAQILLDEWLELDGRQTGTPTVGDSPFNPLFIEALENHPGSGFSLQFSESLAPAVENGELPCGFVDLTLGFQETSHEGSLSSLDFCDEISQHLGCGIEEISERLLTSSVGGANTADLSMTATHVCRLPDVASSCAEGIYCMNPDPSATGLSYVATAFDGDPANLAPNADLRCKEGGRTAAFAFDTNTPAGRSVVQAVDECIAELQTLANLPPTSAPSLGGPGFLALFGDADCIDVGRVLTALQVQTSFSRNPDPQVDPFLNARGAAYTQRLLSRWLTLHAFLANEASETMEMIEVFTAEDLATGSGFVNIEAARNTSLQGWELLLSQEVLHGLLTAPQYALEVPDYRFHAVGLDSPLQTEQKQALAAVILETLEKQSELINKGFQSPAVVLADQLDLLREFTPRSIIAQALAADMYARTSPEESSWHPNYDRAVQRLQSKSATTYALPLELARGTNTLGIADSDLPLYFQASSLDGASQRFAAVSDFIAGSGPGSSAWAPAAVAQARASLEEARNSFVEQAQRDVLTARYDRDLAVWGDDVRTDLNAALRDYCGPVEESLIDDPDFNAARCAVDHSDPTCRIDLDGWYRSWRPADLQSRFCMHQEISSSSFDNTLGFADGRTRDFANRCTPSASGAEFPVSIQPCEDRARGGLCLRCDGDAAVPELPLGGSSLEIRKKQNHLEMSQQELNHFNRMWSRCEGRFPLLRRNIPLPDSPLEKPYCLSGSLGEAYLDLVSADFDIQEARQAFDDHLKAYDIAMESCYILERTNREIQESRSAHQANMVQLRATKNRADNMAAVAAGIKECTATVAGADFSTPWGGAIAGVATAASCIAGGVETAANIASMDMARNIENAQGLHENQVADTQARGDLRICFNDAKMELVGLSTASVGMERAAFDFQAAQANLTNLINAAQLLHSEGNAYLLEEELYAVPSPAGDRWTNERVRRYTRQMKLARRATYLAVRAIEYEYQQSLGLRQDVLSAKIPDDLDAVLEVLWGASGTRAINGNRPTQLSTVLSLRRDILQVGDESNWPDAERPQTAQERFQIMLTSERYAVYDNNGRYSGQRIPFSLTPLQALGFENDAVSLYSVNDCAERLWSVNASLVGENLYRGSDTSFVRLDLLKRNTFYSQWCGQAPDGKRFQYASVRPARNLFREPGVGQEFGPSTVSGQSIDRFSRARIQAFFGVNRATLEDTRYASGETSELAARGIYGDYAIFIPAALIARDGGNGLVLEHIDDILLRLDYLSVATD